MIPSISYDQHEILRWINELHLDGQWIECDPCYGAGNFYKPEDIQQPRYIYDINSYSATSRDIEVKQMPLHIDCRDMPLADGSVTSLIFDPPFLQTTGKGSIIKDRFGSYATMQELWEMYRDAIEEFSRVLRVGGILIVKMQNTVMSGKQWWNVDYINRLCLSGYDKVDEFVLLAKHRMPQHNMISQRHARKYHCFFTVYRRR